MQYVIALGFFDGVHVGHGALMEMASKRAKEKGIGSMALTFDRHPDELTHGEPVPLLNTKAERAEIIKQHFHIDQVTFLPFDREMMRMPWGRFLEDILIREMGAAHVVAGHDFCFGYRGEGTAAKLWARCRELGIGCDIIPKVEMEGITVSSTYIRSLVAAGDVERAAEFLGYHHFISGVTKRGRGIGSKELYATANIPLPEGLLEPREGVYATRVSVNGQLYDAVTNVGVNPTVAEDGSLVIESHLMDFSDTLYDKDLRVYFYKYLRPEQKFESIAALKAQIGRDIDTARSYLAAHIEL